MAGSVRNTAHLLAYPARKIFDQPEK